MCGQGLALIIPAMTPPSSARKVLLIPTGSSAERAGQPAVRRYRVAGLRLDTPDAAFPKRFEYLKRTFD